MSAAIIDTLPASGGRPGVTYRHAGDRFLLLEYGDMVLDLCTEDERYARAVVEAVGALGSDLILLLSGELVAAAARSAGVPFVAEGYIDLDYDDAGRLVIERVKRTREPAEVARRAVLLAREGRVPTPGGSVLLPAASVCVHGDAPNVPAVARAVREALVAAGVAPTPLRRLVAGGKESR